MRTGEVCTLTWDDIDFENRIIKINKTVYCKTKDNKGRWFFGTTKTDGSNREVYICETLLKILRSYQNYQSNNRKKYKTKYYDYYLEEVKNKYGKVVENRIIELKYKSKKKEKINLVFVKDNGRYIGTDLIRYPYRIIHHELGINNCRFYDLRGSFATKTLRSGVEIKDVAEVLGHNRVETTENYYVSSTKESKKHVSNVFEQQLNKLERKDN